MHTIGTLKKERKCNFVLVVAFRAPYFSTKKAGEDFDQLISLPVQQVHFPGLTLI